MDMEDEDEDEDDGWEGGRTETLNQNLSAVSFQGEKFLSRQQS